MKTFWLLLNKRKLWPHVSIVLSGNSWLELKSHRLFWIITSEVHRTLQYFLLCHLGTGPPQGLCTPCMRCLRHWFREMPVSLPPLKHRPLKEALAASVSHSKPLLSIPRLCIPLPPVPHLLFLLEVLYHHLVPLLTAGVQNS